MQQRLQQLQRLTSAMQTRKRAYELRMAQINSGIARLTGERANLLTAASGAEVFPGASLHYVKRLAMIDRQLSLQQNEVNQLRLLHMKAGADLRRAEIIMETEAAAVERLKEARYLEQVVDTALLRRPAG